MEKRIEALTLTARSIDRGSIPFRNYTDHCPSSVALDPALQVSLTIQ
jgi:hypothetical protein